MTSMNGVIPTDHYEFAVRFAQYAQDQPQTPERSPFETLPFEKLIKSMTTHGPELQVSLEPQVTNEPIEMPQQVTLRRPTTAGDFMNILLRRSY